jgi:hypothetical protein
VGSQRRAPATLPQERDLVPTAQETGWAVGPVWTYLENLALPGYEPWTIQPVASHNINYFIPDLLSSYNGFKQ